MSYHKTFREDLSAQQNGYFFDLVLTHWHYPLYIIVPIVFIILRTLLKNVIKTYKPDGPLSNTVFKRCLNTFWRMLYSGNLYYSTNYYKSDRSAPRILILDNLMRFNDRDYHDYCNKCLVFGHHTNSLDHAVSIEPIFAALQFKVTGANKLTTRPVRNLAYNVTHINSFMNNPELFVERNNGIGSVIQRESLPTAFAVAKLSEVQHLETAVVKILSDDYTVYMNNTREIPHLCFFAYTDLDSLQKLLSNLALNYTNLTTNGTQFKNLLSKMTVYTDELVENNYFTYLAVVNTPLEFTNNVDLVDKTNALINGLKTNIIRSTPVDIPSTSSSSEQSRESRNNNERADTREQRAHNHKCIKCGKLYIHYHRYKYAAHPQYPKQCPNTQCEWYHDGNNETEARLVQKIRNDNNETTTIKYLQDSEDLTPMQRYSFRRSLFNGTNKLMNPFSSKPSTSTGITTDSSSPDLRPTYPGNNSAATSSTSGNSDSSDDASVETPEPTETKRGSNSNLPTPPLMTKTILFVAIISCLLPAPSTAICYKYVNNADVINVDLNSNHDFAAKRCLPQRDILGTGAQKYFNSLLTGNCFSDGTQYKRLSQFANLYPIQNLDNLQSFNYSALTAIGNTIHDYVDSSSNINPGYVLLFTKQEMHYFDLITQANNFNIVNFFGQKLPKNGKRNAYITYNLYYPGLIAQLTANRTHDHLILALDDIQCDHPSCTIFNYSENEKFLNVKLMGKIEKKIQHSESGVILDINSECFSECECLEYNVLTQTETGINKILTTQDYTTHFYESEMYFRQYRTSIIDSFEAGTFELRDYKLSKFLIGNQEFCKEQPCIYNPDKADTTTCVNSIGFEMQCGSNDLDCLEYQKLFCTETMDVNTPIQPLDILPTHDPDDVYITISSPAIDCDKLPKHFGNLNGNNHFVATEIEHLTPIAEAFEMYSENCPGKTSGIELVHNFERKSALEYCLTGKNYIFLSVVDYEHKSTDYATQLQDFQNFQYTLHELKNESCFNDINRHTVFILINTTIAAKPDLNQFSKLLNTMHYYTTNYSFGIPDFFPQNEINVFTTLNSYFGENVGPDYDRYLYSCGARNIDLCNLINHMDTDSLYEHCSKNKLETLFIELITPYTMSGGLTGFEREYINLTTTNFHKMARAIGYSFNGQTRLLNRNLFYIPGTYVSSYHDENTRFFCKSDGFEPFTSRNVYGCIPQKTGFFYCDSLIHSIRDPVLIICTAVLSIIFSIIAIYLFDTTTAYILRFIYIAVGLYFSTIKISLGWLITSIIGMYNWFASFVDSEIDFIPLFTYCAIAWFVINLLSYVVLYRQHLSSGKPRPTETIIRLTKFLFLTMETVYIIGRVLIPAASGFPSLYIITGITICIIIVSFIQRLLCVKPIWRKPIVTYREMVHFIEDMRNETGKTSNEALRAFINSRIKQLTLGVATAVDWDLVAKYSFTNEAIAAVQRGNSLHEEYASELPSSNTLMSRYMAYGPSSGNANHGESVLLNENTSTHNNARFRLPTVNPDSFISLTYIDPVSGVRNTLNAPIVHSELYIERHIFGDNGAAFETNFANGYGFKHLSLSVSKSRFNFDNYRTVETLIVVPLNIPDQSTHYTINSSALDYEGDVVVYGRTGDPTRPWMYGFCSGGITTIPSTAGDCGSIYFDTDGFLLGMHCAGAGNTNYRAPSLPGQKHCERATNIWSEYNNINKHPTSYFITLDGRTTICTESAEESRFYDFATTYCYRISPPCSKRNTIITLSYLTTRRQPGFTTFDQRLMRDFGITHKNYVDNGSLPINYDDFVENFNAYTTQTIAGISFEDAIKYGPPKHIVDRMLGNQSQISNNGNTTKPTETTTTIINRYAIHPIIIAFLLDALVLLYFVHEHFNLDNNGCYIQYCIIALTHFYFLYRDSGACSFIFRMTFTLLLIAYLVIINYILQAVREMDTSVYQFDVDSLIETLIKVRYGVSVIIVLLNHMHVKSEKLDANQIKNNNQTTLQPYSIRIIPIIDETMDALGAYHTSWILYALVSLTVIRIFPIIVLIRALFKRERYFLTYATLQCITRLIGHFTYLYYRAKIEDGGIGSPTYETRSETLLFITYTMFIVEYIIGEFFHPNRRVDLKQKLCRLATFTTLRAIVLGILLALYYRGFDTGLYVRNYYFTGFIYATISLIYACGRGENRYYWIIRSIFQYLICTFYYYQLIAVYKLAPEKYLPATYIIFIIQTVEMAMWEASRPSEVDIVDVALKALRITNNSTLTKTQEILNKRLGNDRDKCVYFSNFLKVVKPDPAFADLTVMTEEVDDLCNAWDENSSATFNRNVDRFIDLYPAFYAYVKNLELNEQLGVLMSFIRDDGTFEMGRFESQFGMFGELNEKRIIDGLVNNKMIEILQDHKMDFKNLNNSLDDNKALGLFTILAANLTDFSPENREYMAELARRATEHCERVTNNPDEDFDVCDVQTAYHQISEMLESAKHELPIPTEKSQLAGYNANMSKTLQILSKLRRIININGDRERRMAAAEQKAAKTALQEMRTQQAQIKRVQKQNMCIAIALASFVNLARANQYLREQRQLNNQCVQEPLDFLAALIETLIARKLISTDFGRQLLGEVKSNTIQNNGINDAIWVGNRWILIPSICGNHEFSCNENHRHGLYPCLNNISDRWYAHVGDCNKCLENYNKRIHPICGAKYDRNDESYLRNKQPTLLAFVYRLHSCVSCTYCTNCVAGYRMPSCTNTHRHRGDVDQITERICGTVDENQSFNVVGLPRNIEDLKINVTPGRTVILNASGKPIAIRTLAKLDSAPAYYIFVPNSNDPSGYYYIHTTVNGRSDITSLINRLHAHAIKQLQQQQYTNIGQSNPVEMHEDCGATSSGPISANIKLLPGYTIYRTNSDLAKSLTNTFIEMAGSVPVHVYSNYESTHPIRVRITSSDGLPLDGVPQNIDTIEHVRSFFKNNLSDFLPHGSDFLDGRL